MSLAAAIYAQNLDRLAEFYTALGLAVDERERGDYTVLTGSGTELSIIQIPEPIASQIEITDPPQVRTTAPIKLVFVVSSIDQTLAAALRLGGRVDDDSKRWQFRGHSVQDAVDPEGNRFQLREPH